MTEARRRAVRAALAEGRALLVPAGLEDSPIEAELLLAHPHRCDRLAQHTDPPEPGAEALALYRSLLARRALREPSAYLTGTAEFRSREFRVGPGVLVPRPETEHLVEEALRLLPPDREARVVDVGTGSGCIAVSVALERPRATVIGVDRSGEALAYARGNGAALGAGGNLSFVQGDLLFGIIGRFDLVISNPPYVGEGEEVDPEVLHEPREALFAGADGLDVYRRLVPEAARVLRPGGWLLLEISPGQVEAVHALARAAGLETAEPLPDLAGRPRVVRSKSVSDTC